MASGRRLRPTLRTASTIASDVATWLGAPALAIWLGAECSVWRDDLAAVRAAGAVLRAGDALPSTLLSIAANALPVGSHAYRAMLVSALATAIVAALVRGVAARLLAAEGAPWGRTLLLSTAAALLAGLSPTLQREATVGGSASVATALSLGALALSLGGPRSLSRDAALGAILGLLALESPVTGLACAPALALALASSADARRRLASSLSCIACGAAVTALAVAWPTWLRAPSSAPHLEVSVASSIGELLHTDVTSLRARGLGTFFGELGGLALLLAGIGAVTGLNGGRSRRLVLPLLALIVVDLLIPPRSSGALAADPFAAVRALAVAAAATLAQVGVAACVELVTTTGLSFARPAGTMIVAFSLSLVALSADEARAGDRRSRRGAEAFTREGLDSLPHGAVVLVRSEVIAHRLSAARLEGRRPDVLVIPAPLLGRGRLAARLLAEEPALLPLLRDLGALGTPTEHAMSSLADVRPLYTELDPSWDRRLASHTLPEHLFLRFMPQPLAPTDRVQGSVDTLAADQRVLAASTVDDLRDPVTCQVLALLARGELSAAQIQGEKIAALRALGRLTRLGQEPPPTDPLWETFAPKRHEPRGPRARAR